MCGICGFTGEIIDREKVLKNMTDVITHRGPDSEGFYTDGNINMGFRRLSIIALDSGHQPIYNEDKTLVLTWENIVRCTSLMIQVFMRNSISPLATWDSIL